MHLAERAPQEHQPFLRVVVAGLRETASRRLLSASLVSFALGNVALATYFVLGPLVAERELGGARPWGFTLTGGAVGGLTGSLLAIRYTPARPLLFGNRDHILQRHVGHRASGTHPSSGAFARELARRGGVVRLHATRLHDRRTALG
jgi:hypothetical protein